MEESSVDEEEDYAYSLIPKKRKTNGCNSNSICMYNEIEDFSSGSGSWCSEGPYWTGEVQSNSKRFKNQSLERSRPPGLRSSRGRVQILPSKFNDSVLDSWKNDERILDDTNSNLEDDEFVEDREDSDSEKFGYGKMRFVKGKFGFGNSDSYPFYGREGNGEVDCVGFNNFQYRNCNKKYLSLHNSLIESEEFVPRFRYTGLEKLKRERAAKRKDVYKPEDFALGDIIWAKCGKRYPWWPAVLIDPILQAPQAVLNCCVPGAICVMFYGYSKNGTQRVFISLQFFVLCVFIA